MIDTDTKEWQYSALLLSIELSWLRTENCVNLYSPQSSDISKINSYVELWHILISEYICNEFLGSMIDTMILINTK